MGLRRDVGGFNMLLLLYYLIPVDPFDMRFVQIQKIQPPPSTTL